MCRCGLQRHISERSEQGRRTVGAADQPPGPQVRRETLGVTWTDQALNFRRIMGFPQGGGLLPPCLSKR